MIDRLARGAHRIGGLAEYGGDLKVALGPLFKLCAGTRRLVSDLLELGDALLSAREPFAQLSLGQLGAAGAAIGEHSFVDEAFGIVLRRVDLLH